MDSFDAFVNGLFTVERWPFWSAVLVLMIFGRFASLKFFTRERAYRDPGAPALGVRPFWYWGRETLMVHPIVAGTLLGLVWSDPEGHGWSRPASCMYFAAAGAVSLFGWALLKAWEKKRGLKLTLLGDSERPSKG